MPELPEVETTRRGIAPYITGHRISGVIVREPRLRWPIPPDLGQKLGGRRIQSVGRRGKYLLLEADQGAVVIHLGMSGSLRLVDPAEPPQRHDHLDILFWNGRCLRLRDPRRFGAVLWVESDPRDHGLLARLGPEPLENDFDGDYLYGRSRGRRTAIKPFLMDNRIVVGVGNIYACESLYLAGIHPLRPAGRISRNRYRRLASSVRQTLCQAIAAGGTTLRDFLSSEGRPGYFRQQLQVYGRAGEPCPRCSTPIRQVRQGQRSTFFCGRCQT